VFSGPKSFNQTSTDRQLINLNSHKNPENHLAFNTADPQLIIGLDDQRTELNQLTTRANYHKTAEHPRVRKADLDEVFGHQLTAGAAKDEVRGIDTPGDLQHGKEISLGMEYQGLVLNL
jgi:hypothetical protein